MGIGNPHGYPDFTWPMVWVLQDGELWPISDWVSHVGQFKSFTLARSVNAGATVSDDLYTVPAGKVLYITSFVFSAEQAFNFTLQYTAPLVYLCGGYLAARYPFLFSFVPPGKVGAGKTLTVAQTNTGGVAGSSFVVVLGYEQDV